MKISKDLPQFKEEKALLIVSGEKEAKFLIAGDSKVEETENLRVETPKYSDREGRFEKRGKNKFFGSGSVYEPKKKELRKEFAKKMEESLKKMSKEKNLNEIYLFSSEHMIKIVKGSLSPSMKKNLEETFKGNYNDQHPFKLLEKIKEKKEKEVKDKKVVPKRRAAQKILEKFRKAKGFIKR